MLFETGFAMIQRRTESIIVALGETEIPSDLDGIRRICAPELNYDLEEKLHNYFNLMR